MPTSELASLPSTMCFFPHGQLYLVLFNFFTHFSFVLAPQEANNKLNGQMTTQGKAIQALLLPRVAGGVGLRLLLSQPIFSLRHWHLDSSRFCFFHL